MLRIHTDTGGGAISTDADAVEPLARRLREPLSGAELLERYRGVTGQVRTIYRIHGVESRVDWPFVLYLFTAIGAQTLAIRGSEKSKYGKLFEKLVLGSLLTLLGFQRIDPGDAEKKQRVFWLSSRGSRRESDATLLYKPGVGARFDIGFIGPGNTEISLDKVSRFEREMERGSKVHYMSTIVLVDRIGEKSRIAEMARAIDGDIVQMSMTYWTQEVARILERRIGFKHPITKMPAAESLRYVRTWMATADLHAVIG